MKGLIPFSGQEPLLEDFDQYLELQKEEAIKERLVDMVQAGIVHQSAGYSSEFQVTVNSGDNTRIDIGFGIGYNDVGERVLINQNENYDPTRPSRVIYGDSVPGNIGNIAVPMANYGAGVINHVWLQYLQTKDSTIYEEHPITLQRYFVKGLDGYTIVVNTSNDPVSNPLSNAVFVASVTAQGSGQPLLLSGVNVANRTYASIRLNRVLIKTPKADRSDATTDYHAEEYHDLDKHIQAVGTGVIAPTNPHGLTLADLGYSGGTEPLNELYQKETHDNKVITGSPLSTSSALYPQLVIVDPGNDYIDVYNMTSTEQAYVNGKRYIRSSALNGATVAQISFVGQVTNTYYGFLDNTGNVQITSDFANVVLAGGFLQLFAVTWSPATGNLTNPDDSTRTVRDMRTFIGENNTEVRFSQPQASELFPGRRWLNLTDGQFYGVKDTLGTIVITG